MLGATALHHSPFAERAYGIPSGPDAAEIKLGAPENWGKK